jgi:hypothetical protein
MESYSELHGKTPSQKKQNETKTETPNPKSQHPLPQNLPKVSLFSQTTISVECFTPLHS